MLSLLSPLRHWKKDVIFGYLAVSFNDFPKMLLLLAVPLCILMQELPICVHVIRFYGSRFFNANEENRIP